ncbi:MAG TPA: cadmium resistance transporter [Edaphobacter sp.]|nr:cadmium resistance transporter [Edaphobacter sp.]
MTSFLSLIGLALLLFASTNVDDIFILVGFFADRRYSSRDVVAGQFGGIAVLFGVSVTGALLSIAVPKPYIGLLGLLPIFIGCRGLWNLAHRVDGSEDLPEHHPGGTTWVKTVSVALVTISSGADNLAVYIPSFALRSHRELFLIGVVFVAMTALWCLLAQRIVSHPPLGAPLKRHGHRIAPVVLICLGGLILYQAGTLHLLMGR